MPNLLHGFNPFITRMYHVYGPRKFENFQVMSFFENGSFQQDIPQLMCCTPPLTQIVIRKARTGSLHSAGNSLIYAYNPSF